MLASGQKWQEGIGVALTKVSAAVDYINRRYGAGAITWGANQPHPGFFERG